MIYRPKTLVTLNILYYRLDHPLLLQEFLWQTDDVVPELIRVHKFLVYWQKNIEAKIQEILVSHGGKNNWRRLDHIIQ